MVISMIGKGGSQKGEGLEFERRLPTRLLGICFCKFRERRFYFIAEDASCWIRFAIIGAVFICMFGKYLHALNVAQAAGLFKACLKEPQAFFGRAQAQSKNLVLIYQNKVPDICSYSFSILFLHFEAINSATRTCQHCFVVLNCWGYRQKWRRCWRKGGRTSKNGDRRGLGWKLVFQHGDVCGCLWMLVNEGAWRFINKLPIQGNVGREKLANGLKTQGPAQRQVASLLDIESWPIWGTEHKKRSC